MRGLHFPGSPLIGLHLISLHLKAWILIDLRGRFAHDKFFSMLAFDSLACDKSVVKGHAPDRLGCKAMVLMIGLWKRKGL